MSVNLGQDHRPANSLLNLRPAWQPGQSGNPGGKPKGTPSIPVIIARLLAMSAADWQSFEPENAAEVIALQAIKDAARSTFVDPAAVKSREFIVNRVDGPLEKRITIDTSQEASIRREVRNRYQQAMEMNEAVANASHCQHCGRIVSLSDERIKEIIVNQFPPQMQGIVVQELGDG